MTCPALEALEEILRDHINAYDLGLSKEYRRLRGEEDGEDIKCAESAITAIQRVARAAIREGCDGYEAGYQEGANEGHSTGCNDDSCACWAAGSQDGLEAQREPAGRGTA